MKRVLLLYFYILLVLKVFPQETLSISGTVKSDLNETLQGVTVSVIGQKVTVITNAQGPLQ